MRFPLPSFPSEFEIPDDWLAEAGVLRFTPTTQAYRSTGDATLVALSEIEPPPRLLTYPKDWRGFDRSRLVKVLKEIVSDNEIWPVPLHKLLTQQYLPTPYCYCVANGYHRFYATIIAGYKFLPAAIL